jgi:hypothetical protein
MRKQFHAVALIQHRLSCRQAARTGPNPTSNILTKRSYEKKVFCIAATNIFQSNNALYKNK